MQAKFIKIKSDPDNNYHKETKKTHQFSIDILVCSGGHDE
jgi:hypothetical protein